mmetsp:Transcript_5276/g.17642  ORF Transcript_5276/g.17642 Transcript_5276/m.17642 type:complete len:283 (-) Transcript_5276:698-1546(-)
MEPALTAATVAPLRFAATLASFSFSSDVSFFARNSVMWFPFDSYRNPPAVRATAMGNATLLICFALPRNGGRRRWTPCLAASTLDKLTRGLRFLTKTAGATGAFFVFVLRFASASIAVSFSGDKPNFPSTFDVAKPEPQGLRFVMSCAERRAFCFCASSVPPSSSTSETHSDSEDGAYDEIHDDRRDDCFRVDFLTARRSPKLKTPPPADEWFDIFGTRRRVDVRVVSVNPVTTLSSSRTRRFSNSVSRWCASVDSESNDVSDALSRAGDITRFRRTCSVCG